MNIKKTIQVAVALLLLAVTAAIIPALISPTDAQAQSRFRADGSPIFDTEVNGVTSQVTNKVVPYNITSYGATNAPINVAGAEYAYVQFHQRYTTTGIPSTNTTYVLQTSGDGVNWINLSTVAVAGSTTDGAYTEWCTNYNIGAAKWIRVYSILPLAPLTNSQVSIYPK